MELTASADRATARACEDMIVLVLDDDENFRHAVAENLRDDGHTVLECDAPDRLPPLASLDRVTLVVTDYQMPSGDGISFADAFHATYPRVPIVLVTAESTPRLDVETAARSFLRVLRKPVDYGHLHALLHQLSG